MSIITVGIDLAKNVFAAHAIDDNGKFLQESGYAGNKGTRNKWMLPFSRYRLATSGLP
jgi:hypothetical protein